MKELRFRRGLMREAHRKGCRDSRRTETGRHFEGDIRREDCDAPLREVGDFRCKAHFALGASSPARQPVIAGVRFAVCGAILGPQAQGFLRDTTPRRSRCAIAGAMSRRCST